MSETQTRFVNLVKAITRLQWVRESLPAHSKYYESLKKKLEKELKRNEQEKRHNSDINSSTSKPYSNSSVAEQLQAQIDQAKVMLIELNVEKEKLNELYKELHLLYDQIIIPDSKDLTFLLAQQLKRDAEKLSTEIPNISVRIETCKEAQRKLYQAWELIETAMKLLPGAGGASIFIDKQTVIIGNNNDTVTSSRKPAKPSADSIKKAYKMTQLSYKLVFEASELCPEDVLNIPVAQPPNDQEDTNVIQLLTNYREYRLKIEAVLRTQLNPRLHGLENQLSSAKYQYEQRAIEWIDLEIMTLEAYLRVNQCLENESLDKEISMLSMGSRAAIAAIISESSDRVTVDDVLDISIATTLENGGNSPLPEYHEEEEEGSSAHQSPSLPELLPFYAVNDFPPPPAYSNR